jgi:sugar phosphate isomerase/epimerase
MKLCLNTFAYIRYPIEAALQNTGRVGYRAVEIVANRPHLLPEDYSQEDRKQIASLARSLELDIPAVTSFNGTPQWHFAHPKREVRRSTTKHVKESVALAVELGASIVEVVSGVPHIDGVPPERAWAWMTEELAECADYAKKHGVKIGLEPEPGNVVSTTREAMLMSSEIASQGLGILLDTGHLNVVKEEIPNSIASARDRLIHVHVNDNNGETDQHLVPGDGMIDFRAVLEALHRIGYDKYLTIELEQSDGDSSALRSRKFIESLLRGSAGDDRAD